MWWMLMLACRTDEAPPAPTPPPAHTGSDTGATPSPTDTAAPTGDTATAGPTAHTGDTAVADVLAASCALHPDHPLIVACSATLASAGDAELVLTAATAPERRFTATGAAPSLTASFTGWGLEADTTYTWTLGTFTGQVTTGPLPEALRDAQIDVTGAFIGGVDAVLMPLSCGTRFFLLIGEDGSILWFTSTDVYANQMHGYHWVAERPDAPPALLTLNEGVFVETDLFGDDVVRAAPPRGELHHDASHWGEYRYTLFRDDVGRFEVDGVHVWQGGNVIGSFFLGDHYTPSGGDNDWSHANGIQADDQGRLMMSMLHFDSVLAIDGDPASPTFLEPLWLVDGTGAGALAPGDYVPVSNDPLEGVSGQHNASLVGGDALWLFDNDGAGRGSRAAQFTLDSASGTFAHAQSWDLGITCRIQGGAVPVDGGVLVTCATTGDVALMEEGQTAAAWTLDASCDGGPFGVLPTHAIPVHIGD